MALSRKPLTEEKRGLLEAWTAGYKDQLDDQAMEWLEGHRGLEWPTVSRFRLGVVRQPLTADHDYLRDRVVIPNICQAGHVVGLKFGSMDPTCEPRFKYLYQRGWGDTRLWNLQALNYCRSQIFVTEGEFKALALEDMGLPAIAVPGANTMTGAQYRKRIFDDLDVVLVRDSDEGGQKLVDSMEWVSRVVNPAPAKGIDDLRKEEGDSAVLARLYG